MEEAGPRVGEARPKTAKVLSKVHEEGWNEGDDDAWLIDECEGEAWCK